MVKIITAVAFAGLLATGAAEAGESAAPRQLAPSRIDAVFKAGPESCDAGLHARGAALTGPFEAVAARSGAGKGELMLATASGL